MLKKIKNRKKGNLFIEQLLVLPIFIAVVWLIIQLILFSYSNNQINTAANETASTVSHYLRGNPQLASTYEITGSDEYLPLDHSSVGSDISGPIKDVAIQRMVDVTMTNNFVLFAKDRDGEFIDDIEDSYANNAEQCSTDLKNKDRVLCVYLEKDSGGTNQSGSFQVITRTKAPFNLIGNFIAVLGSNFDTFHVYGNSSAPIDMPGRFHYNQ